MIPRADPATISAAMTSGALFVRYSLTGFLRLWMARQSCELTVLADRVLADRCSSPAPAATARNPRGGPAGELGARPDGVHARAQRLRVHPGTHEWSSEAGYYLPAAQRRRRPGQVHVLVAHLAGDRHRAGRGLVTEVAGDEGFHLIQQAQHLGQGRIPGRGIVPVPVQRGLQARGSQLAHPGLRCHDGGPCGLPP
ncbi:MAG TPA: hypothetical protein VHZ03_16260, partial [Trebonia sp.]|nr:hypothetical protein [Trebonia sp.]